MMAVHHPIEPYPAIAHAAVIRSFFPSSVAVHAAGPSDHQASLYPEESAIVRQAVRTRREDFAAGRFCARRALADLGVASSSILAGPGGSPIWPPGYVGSISHCAGLRVAVAARRGDVSAIGIDVELADPLTPDVARLVCRVDEIAAFAHLPLLEGGAWEKVTFSAKESVYKCQYPGTRKFLDFSDVAVSFAEIDSDCRGGAFDAEVRVTATQATHFTGRWRILGNHIHTGVLSA